MMILPHFTDVKMTWSVASCKVTLPYNSKDISTMFDTTQYFRKWRSLHEKKKKKLANLQRDNCYVPKRSLFLAHKLHD